MRDSYDLTNLDSNSFEHLVNLLATRVLGHGHTGFGPGPDGGRDGYFEGNAPYPSKTECWSGVWYIQSKFFASQIAKDPQKWLLERIEEEIKEFTKHGTKRVWPDNWIIATNIDPSGTPNTGAFDKARALVKKANPKLFNRFHIWGGNTIINLLTLHPEVSARYQHFLTPGHVLTSIYNQIQDAQAEIDTILRFLIVKQFKEQQYTKLDQAGSSADNRPGIQRLFIDVPFRATDYYTEGLVLNYLIQTASRNHQVDAQLPMTKEWRFWSKHPSRARVWFIKGGPGQGKSTIGQYFCQIQRAALILDDERLIIKPEQRELAQEIKIIATNSGYWPVVPRIPISIELREFAQWYGQRNKKFSVGILTFLAEKIQAKVEQQVHVGTLKRALASQSWFVAFDGLDEVPTDVKDVVAAEVQNFVDDVTFECNADVLTICTSRPQGYSGQFDELDAPTINLTYLNPDQALRCAKTVLELGRSEEESKKSYELLQSAIKSSSIRELMISPLQSHIMAIVVRDGGRPPERKWKLYSNFYQVIKKREANRDLPDIKLAKLLREDEKLLKKVHNRLGFTLHARAETSKGADTHLQRSEFKDLLKETVSQMMDENISGTVEVLMEATTDRLVLVSTPDDGNHVRFDIRSLQEFFAAEFLYESISADELRDRMTIISGDSHWREVMHFLLSALLEQERRTELAVAIEVLEQLDEGTDYSPIRMLNLRLGRGGLLSSRLLKEGVLEQDRQLRELFKQCLKPLMSFTELETLKHLLLVQQPNSKSWLCNYLVQVVQESALSESIGALIVLAHILPNNHEKTHEIKELILHTDQETVKFILLTVRPSLDSNSHQRIELLQKWFLDVLFKIILLPVCKFLDEDAYIQIRIFFRHIDNKTLNSIIKENHLSESHTKLLNIYISETDKPIELEWSINYGIIKATHYEHDWSTQSSDFDALNDKFLEEASSATGILQLIYRIILFNKQKTKQSILLLLEYIENYPQLFFSLPGKLRAYVPINQKYGFNYPDIIRTQLYMLRSLTNDSLKMLLCDHEVESIKLHRPHGNLMFDDRTCTLSQWTELVDNLPYIALEVLSDTILHTSNRLKTLENTEAVDILIEKLLKSPKALAKYSASWGLLIAKTTNYESALREAFLEASSEDIYQSFLWINKIHTFDLVLPKELSMLPHILNNILYHIDPLGDSSSKKSNNNNYKKTISEYISKVSDLERALNGEELNLDIKIAVVVMILLHPKSKKELNDYNQVLIQMSTIKSSLWRVKATTICLALLTNEDDVTARIIVGNILYTNRSNLNIRKQTQKLLTLWRETSRAPLQKANVIEKWLA